MPCASRSREPFRIYLFDPKTVAEEIIVEQFQDAIQDPGFLLAILKLLDVQVFQPQFTLPERRIFPKHGGVARDPTGPHHHALGIG